MYTYKHILLTILVTAIASLSLAGKHPPQRCTAISVPISTNFPVVIAGKKMKAPQEYSAAFKPILSLVELPQGYQAVGGGAGFVIACSER